MPPTKPDAFRLTSVPGGTDPAAQLGALRSTGGLAEARGGAQKDRGTLGASALQQVAGVASSLRTLLRGGR